VTCSKPATVTVAGNLVQVHHGLLARGTYSTQVTCTPGTTSRWTATASPNGDVAFVRGRAQAITTASGFDADFGREVSVSTTTIVNLRRFNP
jgi:hypothetical protein